MLNLLLPTMQQLALMRQKHLFERLDTVVDPDHANLPARGIGVQHPLNNKDPCVVREGVQDVQNVLGCLPPLVRKRDGDANALLAFAELVETLTAFGAPLLILSRLPLLFFDR